ncbi:uncharacterized protein LOC124464118 isoform X2 [Hypomesus transpacificus]|uniref:uncharacterized protein LOC124464118 isoform X2 n=1 Tax=Hypomesus transpacificus TaxID=137520 RepID=UPI001F083AC5|nr:uncharacterized protein LOC124464118 isoform X2 [Hypomesus transpacificus]
MTGAYLETARVCYGTEYVIPSIFESYFIITKLFFKPSYPQGSPKTLVLDKLALKDPRYKSSFSTLRIPDVTEDDDGIFSIMYDDGITFDILRLEVTDCSSKAVLTYGSRFLQTVVSQASTLDFLPLESSEPVVLWNQTDSQAGIEGMGVMESRSWVVSRVTQKHQGHYTFRKSDGRFLSRRNLEVEEQVEWYTLERGETFNINFFLDSTQFNLNYFQEGDPEATLLVRKGIEMYDDPTRNRLEIMDRGFRFQMLNLENQDSGKFELRDQDNNLALVVWLNVKPLVPVETYVFVGVSVVILVGICCCVRKCCCKRNTSKRNASASGSGQVVVHQDETCHMTSQPSGPSYPSPPYFQSYASEPVVTISPAAPSGPTYPYQSTAPPPNPSSTDTTTLKDEPHTQVSTSTGLDPPSFSLGFDFLSSDSETQFKLPQRLNHHTDFSPSSDPSPSADVYNSDKLNFL